MISRRNVAELIDSHGVEAECIDLAPKVEVAPIIIPPNMPLPFIYRCGRGAGAGQEGGGAGRRRAGGGAGGDGGQGRGLKGRRKGTGTLVGDNGPMGAVGQSAVVVHES